MRRMNVLKNIVIILFLAAAILAVGCAGCSGPGSSTPTEIPYRLTHSAADAEHILSWESIVSQFPEIGTYEKQETFVPRRESTQSDN